MGAAESAAAVLVIMVATLGAKLTAKPQGASRNHGAVPLPHAVEDVPVGEDSQHDVIRGRVVNEGPFGVHEEDVWDPDLLHQPAVEGHALVGGAGE